MTTPDPDAALDPAADDRAVADLRRTLAADDYAMEIERTGPGVLVRITAGPDACADCLVPPPIMRGILGGALGVADAEITLVYPDGGAPPDQGT